jgi:superfamily I DNA and/or RNA helicase
MEKTLYFTGEYTGKVIVDYIHNVNYAMVLNNYKVFNSFVIMSMSSSVVPHMNVRISGDMLEATSFDIAELQPNHSVSLENINLIPSMSKLMALTEAFQTSFTITISIDGKEIHRESLPLLLMPFDQWHGDYVMPELLASFVTPNHPCLAPILQRAADKLKMMSGSGSMDDYQSFDYERVKQQVESVYQTLLEENILYASVPASFGDNGQRIRLVDNVLQNKMGTCIELSLLMCSCLEAIGLRTMMLLFQRHAIMGVWLDNAFSAPMVGYDASQIENLLNLKNPPLILLESVGLTKEFDFKSAVNWGSEVFLADASEFCYFVDIRSARMSRVRPLPHIVQQSSGWYVDDKVDYDKWLDTIAEQNPYEINGVSERVKNKQQLWEYKLLDLTLRNNLINMRSGRNIVPLPERSIDDILALLRAEKLQEIVEEKSDFSTLKDLARIARNSIEETGANTLFLSLGTLRWFEADSAKPYFAPIMFVPIEIVRRVARKYIVRSRDDESIVNITLLEMLRQTFDLEVPSLHPLPLDEKDQVDYRQVFAKMQTIVDDINENQPSDRRWAIIEESMMGIFSFSKFVMWNDIHTHADVLLNNPVLRSLMNGSLKLLQSTDSIDVHKLDMNSAPADYAIPLDVDSSQMGAVIDSGKDKSFIIYGPPGTGKSQTITNMIANALYQGKRVLFVSEKKAALDVVYERLRHIGLDTYCLEMHSNKANKKSFLSQLEKALNASQSKAPTTFKQKSKELLALRREINAYAEALHQKRNSDLSLYDYINSYLEIEAEPIALQYADIRHLCVDDVIDICDKLRTLDTITNIIGKHPSSHPLLGLYPCENTVENQVRLSALITKLPDFITQIKRKEQHWFNRWFMKRTALQIAQRYDDWNEFFSLAEIDDYLLDDIDIFKYKLQEWGQNLNELRQWYHFSLRYIDLRDNRIDKVLQHFVNNHTGQATAQSFLKGYYKCLIIHTIENDPNLRTFSGLLFSDIIQTYRTLTEKFKKLTERELLVRLSSKLPHDDDPNPQVAKELTQLRKRIANNGRSVSVRRIFDQISGILPRLAPCMLMSPLSVAQYLKMENNQFDLVIFDEASQMPTSEAVGAIARSKAVIVVGDPKQMPPTTFFESQLVSQEYLDYDDMDSILDDCISLGMPSHHLNWHYRSKHESLIAFSNTHFYDGRLITFPSIDDQSSKITLRPVDGYYDIGRTRSNKSEARAIVDEVLNRLSTSDPNNPRTIGIVAFSKVQSMLIEDMLIEALAKHPELEKIAAQAKEPIFVKNLENVQGDERDIILFSVGYGPNKEGKVSMNFGPLNQQGGERRLNVAVSRARYEMVVFSTLKSHQIDLQRTNATGVIALKHFLEYAESHTLPQPISQLQKNNISPIARKIASSFESQGHKVHFNVGRSNFKIDLAVVDPNNPSTYTKAILLDGLQYYQTPTVRDREIIQPNILSSLGWTVQRIWTADQIEPTTNSIVAN